ncbi:MAG: hypothetical protein P8P74_07630, partial [Crocinitomicaceae bacterium]|nr:hypothetical protein [Crocinitomicaceae bacterium]
EDNIPAGSTPSNLTLKTMSKVYRQIIDGEIKSVLGNRNGGLPDNHPDKMNYNQLINIEYQDGAKMLTVGGVIYNNHQTGNYSSANFSALNFMSETHEEFKIDVPKLTYRELNRLESLFPDNINIETGEIIDPNATPLDIDNFSDIIPLRDIKKYSKVYRYFPIFAESNL